MAGTKMSLFLLFLIAFDPSQAGSSCSAPCEVNRSGYCKLRRVEDVYVEAPRLPCAFCNTTGHTDGNQLGCLPPTLPKLQVAGHSDSSGKLKPLPRLVQLYTLLLGPGNIVTAAPETFSAVPNLLGLSMSKNAISVIGSWFGKIRKLTKLDLGWNEIEEIKRNALQPLAKLKFLSLRHNRLCAVEEWYFTGLTELKFLHLNYNNISHITWKAFGQFKCLRKLSLDHNQLLSIPAGALTTMRRIDLVDVKENPFRCTCALESLTSEGPKAASLYAYDCLLCSYPPNLSGRKIADVAKNEMPCPHPTARMSQQDNGATLVCEVFWEKQPQIKWLDPGGRAVGERESLNPCGGAITTSLEHEMPTTQSPEGGTAQSTDGPGLPYIGKSTSTLRLSQQTYRCWTEGSFRCIVQSTPGSVTVETTKGEQGQAHTKMAAVYTTTPVWQNAKVTERITKPTDRKTRQDGTTPAADGAKRKMTTVYTTTPVQQNAGITEKMTKPTDRNTQQGGVTPETDKEDSNIGMMIGIYIISTWLFLFVAFVGRKCCKRQQQMQQKRRQQDRYHIPCNAAGDIPLQNIQPPPAAAPTTGNPAPPRHTYAEIPDDAPIPPYAETSRLENPVYAADVTGTSRSTSTQGLPSKPDNPIASSRPKRPRVVGKAPAPPPRSDGTANTGDSTYYPPATKTTQEQGIPAPLPRTPLNSDVSLQPRNKKKTPAVRTLDPLQRTRQDNVSSKKHNLRTASAPRHGSAVDPQGSGMDEEEEVEGPNIYLDLNGASQQADKIPDPKTNSKVSSQPKRLGIRSRMDEEEEDVEGPNIYLDRNSASRLSDTETTKAEKISDPLPRANSNVSSQPKGLGMRSRVDEEEEAEGPNIYLDLNSTSNLSGTEATQAEEIPDPLPRIHTYVNSNVLSQSKDPETAQAEEIPDPLPRIHTYVNSNVLSQSKDPETAQAEEIPDTLPRIHTYVNSNVLSQSKDPETAQAEEIPDPLPRIHTYVNSNVSSKP